MARNCRAPDETNDDARRVKSFHLHP